MQGGIGPAARRALIAGLFAAFQPSAANADDTVYTGALLLEDFQVCDERPQDYYCGRAANYVKGFAKRLLQGHVGNPSAPQICLDHEVRVAELTETVRRYLEAHRGRGDELAVWLVRDAMIAAYPCPGSDSRPAQP